MSISRAEAAGELLSRRRATSQLATYALRCIAPPALHHQLICQAIDALLADEYDELIILAPPGSAKSTYTSHALPSYYLGKYPDHNIIVATHTSDLSEKWSRKVRNTFTSPEHKAIFPESRLSKDSTAVSRWATSEGGELLAAGVGGSILGFRADLAVIDDPISGFEQAQSITQLAKVHEWYETDFITRLKPNGKVVLICQRLARNDLAGYMVDRNLSNPTRRQRVLTIPMESTGVDDPLGREVGERLWPEWYTEAMVKDAKRDDFKWKTLYQQEPPADTGAWVSTDDFKFAPTPAYSATDFTYYGLTDLALSVGTGDYTVHIVIAHDHRTGYCHVVDCIRKRVDPDVSANDLVSLAETYKPAEWLIDDDNASKVFMQLVATRARQQATPVNWHPLPMRGANKETRAAALRGMFKRHLIYFDPAKPWTNIIVNECLQFPNALGSGVDDCVDTLSLLGRRLSALQAVQEVKAIAPPLTIQSMTLDKLYEDRPRRGNRI